MKAINLQIFHSRIILISLLELFIALVGKAEEQVNSPVLIGQKIPAIVSAKDFRSGKPYDSRSFRGKWTLIDFWSVNCGTCIQKFGELERLQHEFANSLEIILMTRDSKERVERVLQRTGNENLNLNFAVEDSSYYSHFPHQSVPHLVWIDPAGYVRYITYGYFASGENVAKMIKGLPVEFELKQEISDFDPLSPIWAEGGGRLMPHLKYYSMIFGRINEVGSGIFTEKVDSLRGFATIRIYNATLLRLFQIAYNVEPGLASDSQSTRFSIDPSIANRFYRPSGSVEQEGWKNENLYSYEIRVPLEAKNELRKHMQEDLSRFLGYDIEVKKVVRRFWSIKFDNSWSLERDPGLEAIYKFKADFRDFFISNGVRGLFIEAPTISTDSKESANEVISLWGLRVVEKIRCYKLIYIKSKP